MKLNIREEDKKLADKRIYEIVVIIDPKSTEEETTTLTDNLKQIIETQGGSIVKSDDMGLRRMAYEINHRNEGRYWFFEIEGTGGEIAELERRMRVNEAIIRYMTIRVDLDRRRAAKLQEKRTRRSTTRSSNSSRSNDMPFKADDDANEMEEAA